MTNLKIKITAGLSAAAMMGTMITPAFAADTTIDISGNGSNSTNGVSVVNTNTSDVVQKNKTKVDTTVNATGNTGGNKANGNTGDGNVSIDTGDVDTAITITVGGGSNDATVPSCGCDQGALDVVVSGNGNGSTNGANVVNANSSTKKQKNKTKVKTSATVKAKTGKNKANNNTGSGAVDVTTGNVDTTVDVTVDPSSNTLN